MKTPSVLPLASTLDRTDSREDASAYISKIAQAIGAAQPAVGRGYNNYPKDDYEARLSTICKAKRDAAILEKHKDGMSARKIADLFKMNNKTVSTVIEELCKNPESGKLHTP